MAFENHDVTIDSPVNNFATINALDTNSTLSEGNLKVSTSGDYYRALCNFPIEEGKWYYEFAFHSGDPAQVFFPEEKFKSGSDSNVGYLYPATSLFFHGYTNDFGCTLYANDTSVTPAENVEYGTASNLKYVIASLYLDHSGSDLTIYFYREGVLRRKVRLGSDKVHPKYIFGYKFTTTWSSSTQYYNFGQDPYLGGKGTAGGSYVDSAGYGQFNYKPVDENGADLEFYSLCTKNLPSGPIDVHNDDIPADYFKAVTWRGDNVNGRQIDTDGVGTGTGFQPDLVWVAIRSGQAGVQTITDSLRQAGSMISPNGDYNVNVFDASWKGSYGQITELNSTGFKVNKGSSSSNFNSDNNEYVAWTWRAAGPSNSGEVRIIELDGSLSTSTASGFAQAMNANAYPNKLSANRKSGFSMVQYSGIYENARVPHGLSQTPEMIIVKSYSSTENWMVKHKDLSSGHYLMLNHTNQQAQNSTIFETQEDNAQYFWLGGNNAVNTGSNYMAYCWHSVPGYSKIGSYVGVTSGNPYIHLGFRAAFIMIKAIDGSIHSNYQSWSIFDTARNSHNPSNTALYANAAWAEGMDGAGGSGGVGGIDIVSNGFRLLDGAASYSGIDGVRHLYMAFAENPFNAPATAR